MMSDDLQPPTHTHAHAQPSSHTRTHAHVQVWEEAITLIPDLLKRLYAKVPPGPHDWCAINDGKKLCYCESCVRVRGCVYTVHFWLLQGCIRRVMDESGYVRSLRSEVFEGRQPTRGHALSSRVVH